MSDDTKDDIKIETEEENENLDPSAQAEDKIKKIKKELKKCQKEKEEYLDGWQRAKADAINARKEEEKKREEFVKFSNQILLAEILPVLDSFDLAKENSKDKGLVIIRMQLEDILKKYGLEIIKAKGEKFDLALHEAIEEVESDKKSDIIIEEIQKGYTLYGKVLRPAKVKVSR